MNEKLKALLQAVAEVTKIDVDLLQQKKAPSHRIAYAKHVFCYIGCYKLKFKQQEIGDFIGLSQGRVCQVTDRSNFIRINERGCKEVKKEILEVEEKFEEIFGNVNLKPNTVKNPAYQEE
jgi:hypothetical protein